MITMIVNCSGNVGKTTLATEIFKELLGHRIISVETINDGPEGEKFAGADIENILVAAIQPGAIALDVGSSNIETFLTAFSPLRDFAAQFVRVVVIPFTTDTKVWTDVKTTIQGLEAVGIERARVILVPNRIAPSDYQALDSLLAEAAQLGVRGVAPPVFESEAIAAGNVAKTAATAMLTPKELKGLSGEHLAARVRESVQAGRARGAEENLKGVAKALKGLMP